MPPLTLFLLLLTAATLGGLLGGLIAYLVARRFYSRLIIGITRARLHRHP